MNDLMTMQPHGLEVSETQRTLIKKTIAPDATDHELELFFYDNRRKGVHPLDRLIHFTKRKGRYVPITSIHFMRAKADEGGRAGQDQPLYAGKETMPDYECAVTVFKMVEGQKVPYIGVAKWKEYYPGNGDEGFMWRKMPTHMLAKCAEANALRLGFPRELAGLHIEEEVHVLDEPTPAPYDDAPKVLTLKDKLKAKIEEVNPSEILAESERSQEDGASGHEQPVHSQQPSDAPATHNIAPTPAFILKVGRQKGQMVSDHSDENLKWALEYYQGRLLDPVNAKSRYRPEWEESILAIEEEKARR